MATADDVSTLFLRDIGAPVTPGNVKAVTTWLRFENSNPTARNNPWNLHSWGGLPGQTGYSNVGPGDKDVAIFSTLAAGVQANANNLLNLSKTYPQYGNAITQLRQNNPVGFLNAIAASPWSAGHYAAAGGGNKLVNAYSGTSASAGAGAGATAATAPHTSATGRLSGAQLSAYVSSLNASLGFGTIGGGSAGAGAATGGGGGGFASEHAVVFALLIAAGVAALLAFSD